MLHKNQTVVKNYGYQSVLARILHRNRAGVCGGGGWSMCMLRVVRETDWFILRNWLPQLWGLNAKICRASQQAEDPGNSWCYSLSPKAIWRQDSFLLEGGQSSLYSGSSTDWMRPTPITKGSLLYSKSMDLFFFNKFIYLFIYFWLCWVFIAVRRLSPVAVSGGYSSLRCAGLSLQWLLLLWSTGYRHVGFSSCGAWAQ